MNVIRSINNLLRKNRVSISGRGHQVEIPDSVWRTMKKCRITLTGSNNRLVIGDGTQISHANIRLKGSGQTLIIGCNVQYRKGKIYICNGSDGVVSIGDKTTVQGAYLLRDGECEIRIGEDCMFSTDIMIRTGDTHPIFDHDSGSCINKPQSVTVDDHVWIARDVMVLKGSRINKGSIVGAKSLVTKLDHQENSVLAGVPAKVVKVNVRWER